MRMGKCRPGAARFVPLLFACCLIALPALVRAEPLSSGGSTGGFAFPNDEAAAAWLTAYFGEQIPLVFQQQAPTTPPQTEHPQHAARCEEPPGVPEPATVTLGLVALGAAVAAGALRKRWSARSRAAA